MALKNDDSISDIGKRLLDLMQEHGYQSPKELAKALLAHQLIHVKSRKDRFNSPERIQGNAVLSVEKKIVRHIKTGLYGDDSGEYMLGYCKLLNCASDYLLGLTPIKSADIEVRRICEKTGLDESAVSGFIKYKDYDEENDFFPEHECIAGWWSYILSSDLLFSIPNDIRIASEEIQESYRLRSELQIAKWNNEHVADPDVDNEFFIGNELTAKRIEEQLKQLEPHLQGMLYKISRDLTSALEKEIVESNRRLFKDYPDRMLQKHIQLITEHAETDEE